MAVDIGPRIGIDGEKEFRQQLQNLNQQMRTLSSEMKAVTSAFDENDDSQEKWAAQSRVLTKQIETQEQRLQQLQRGLDRAADKFGENDTRTLRWAQAVNNATTDLNQLRQQLRRTGNEMDDVDDSTRDMTDSLQDAGSASGGFAQSLAAGFSAGAVLGIIQSVVDGVNELVESTTEYRRIMASLESSSQRAGYSAEETADVYRQLYSVLADEQTAATTTANLQAIGLAQEQLTDLTDAAIGAWATYGDSIPIDSLAEAINETIRVGQVTGTFADALNWAGTSEDAFNAKLAAASTETERANLVLQELARQGLVEAGAAWRANNSDLTEANLATADLTDTLAGFGAMLSPVVTEAKGLINDLLGVVTSLAQAFQSGGLAGVFERLQEMVPQAVSAIQTQLPAMVQAGFDMVQQLVNGITANASEIASGLGELLAGAYNFMAENAPEWIRQGGELTGQLAQGVIEAIPDFVAELPAILKAFGNYVVSMLPAMLEYGWEILKGVATGIVNAAVELGDMIEGAGEDIINWIIDGAKSLLGDVVGLGEDIINSVSEGISDLADRALQWGKDLIDNFVSGIESKINDIEDAVINVADTVADFLGFSEPDKGPLSNFHTFAPDMMDLFSRGIRENVWRVTDAMDGVASQMQSSIPTPTIETVNNAAAGMVNGLSAISTGQRIRIEVPVYINGKELYRATLDDLRAVERANPEVVTI